MVPITWELLIAIFFIVIAAYSFIIGRDGTIKVIISAYIGILSANALGNLAEQYLLTPATQLAYLELSPEENVILLKIFLFILITLLLILKGAFAVTLSEKKSFIGNFFITGIYGILSAGLIISTILVFISGEHLGGLLSGLSVDNPIIVQGKTIYFNTFIKNYNIWFSLPALFLMTHSFFSKGDEEE
jgi:hypothetical protein